MKIIHLPTSVGGNSWGLSRGERSLGLNSDVLVKYDNWLQYPADKVLFNKPPTSLLKQTLNYQKNFQELLKIRNEYDIFHFNFGTTLFDMQCIGLPLLDLPFYKKKGRIFVTYNGCDARQKFPTIKRTKISACQNETCYGGICGERTDALKQRKIKKFDRYADGIFSLNPDLLYFLPERAQFLPYTIADWNDITVSTIPNNTDQITIAHAPTNRVAKGSDIILKTLERIKTIYPNRITIKIIENQSHSDAVNIYEHADFVIDQVLIGWYGAFAVEAMKMGKPVIAYIREEDLHFLPKMMADDCRKAIINANPDTLYETLIELIEDPQLLKMYRQQGIDYVNRWHDPRYVAGITKKAYETVID